MGGGCVCDKYIEKSLFDSPGNQKFFEKSQNIIQNSYNKISNKTSNILEKLIENSKDPKSHNKRYSDYLNYEKRQIEKNITKNITNNVTNAECPNNSIYETSFLNKKININDDMNKKIYSVNNSSNFNGSYLFPAGSEQKGNEIIEDENIVNNKIDFDPNNAKRKSVIKKIKEREDGFRKSAHNINCNMGEHNFIFINISRGSSFMNNNDIERYESTTPKMMVERENLEEVEKGDKNLFSHFCKHKMDKSGKNINNKIITSVFKPCYDMNKYCEEMLNVINSIRLNPKNFIKHIDYIWKYNITKTDEGIFLKSNEIDEQIKLMDNYVEMFDKAKEKIIEKINNLDNLTELDKFVYNDDLEIIFDESNYSDIDFSKVDSELEEEKDEEKQEEDDKNEIDNDIRNIPSKLSLIYNYDDICVIDDDLDDDEDGNKIKEKENIIDFDKEEKSDNNESSINQLNNSAIHFIGNNDNKNIYNNSNYKIFINNENNGYIKQYKPKKKKKKKKNINSYLDLNDDKIANLILEKRKGIKRQYPKNIFKMSVIKDIKISILIQIMMEEYYNRNSKNNLTEIIFSPNFKHFAVSWTNEVNKNFISISCFA